MIHSIKKTMLFCLVLLIANATLCSQDNLSALMPMVNYYELPQGKPTKFKTNKAKVYMPQKEVGAVYGFLEKVLKNRLGLEIVPSESSKAPISIQINRELKGEEEYVISNKNNRLILEAGTLKGLFYAIQTLDQIFLGDIYHSKQQQIAPIYIHDQPRFPFRGLMLDPARHFLPVADVKFFIDQMARYKFNKLQLHLTDDQGWRMQIKTHPKLTEQGPFYTHEELKDIVAYAAQRHIEVIPELDVPGHVVALLAAYPELGCTNTQQEQKIVGKTENMMLCASNPDVFTIYNDIITEVAQIFPHHTIHMGGDEARIPKNWLKCDKCLSTIKENGYKEGRELMQPFFKEMKKIVDMAGKKLMLWCELDSEYAPATEFLFSYDKDITLITWRWGLTPTCLELTAASGHNLIMAPGEFAYLDYPQLKGDLPEFNNWGMPTTTLQQSYKFDPGYGYPIEKQQHIQGVLGTLWGEAMKDINRVTYMAFPRSLALAEAGWTKMEHRNWEDFLTRMYPNLYNLIKLGVSVRTPFEVVNR